MDFSLSEDQQAVSDLARRILSEQITAERLKEVEAGSELIDRRAWKELAKANLLGVALDEADGGSGQGFLSACIICHGPALKGVGATPAIAGRHTGYMVRQLYFFQDGSRSGPAEALMHNVVQRLTIDDMLAIAAYVASRAP